MLIRTYLVQCWKGSSVHAPLYYNICIRVLWGRKATEALATQLVQSQFFALVSDQDCHLWIGLRVCKGQWYLQGYDIFKWDQRKLPELSELPSGFSGVHQTNQPLTLLLSQCVFLPWKQTGPVERPSQDTHTTRSCTPWSNLASLVNLKLT